MKGSELLKAMASDLGSEKKAREALRAFLRGVCYGLARDGKVYVPRFGRFQAVVHEPRKTRVFSFAEKGVIDLKTRRSVQVFFKSTDDLKTALREGL